MTPGSRGSRASRDASDAAFQFGTQDVSRNAGVSGSFVHECRANTSKCKTLSPDYYRLIYALTWGLHVSLLDILAPDAARPGPAHRVVYAN